MSTRERMPVCHAACMELEELLKIMDRAAANLARLEEVGQVKPVTRTCIRPDSQRQPVIAIRLLEIPPLL